MLGLHHVARPTARCLNFVGFRYRGVKTTEIRVKQEQLVDADDADNEIGKVPTRKWTRTRSILLDDDNPIIYPEKHKLHKKRENKSSDHTDTDDLTDKQEWAEWDSNPYFRMLCTPLRKCIFSNRVLPKDFMVGLKLASYDAPLQKTSPYLTSKPPTEIKTLGQQADNIPTASACSDVPQIAVEANSPYTTMNLLGSRTATSIFPLGIMHLSTPAGQADAVAKGRNRGYVICRRSAAEELAKKDGLFADGSHRNPLLAFQIDSQMRRRIVNELNHLAHKSPDAIKGGLSWTLNTTLDTMQDRLLPHIEAEAIMRDFHAILLLDDVERSTSSFSYMLRSQQYDSNPTLPMPHIPLYRMLSLFRNEDASLISTKSLNESVPPHPDARPQSLRQKAHLNEPPSDYEELKELYPEVYEREAQLSQTLQQTFMDIITQAAHPHRHQNPPTSKVTGSVGPSIVGIRRGYNAATPLLVALWRWRMWIGEGWLGDGWGIKAASGR